MERSGTMNASGAANRLDSEAALVWHLAELLERDPRLVSVAEAAGSFVPRVSGRGFAGLAKVICGQQLSVASARAIWSRFEALPGALEPEIYLTLSEEAVRATGFSGGKYRTLRAVAEAMVGSTLDFEHLETLDAAEAIAMLTAVKGVGPWTAELYLMFCVGHPDLFPAGDLALQKAVQHGLHLNARPDEKTLRQIAEAWRPHRATAALLFWRYFAVLKERDGVVF